MSLTRRLTVFISKSRTLHLEIDQFDKLCVFSYYLPGLRQNIFFLMSWHVFIGQIQLSVTLVQPVLRFSQISPTANVRCKISNLQKIQKTYITYNSWFKIIFTYFIRNEWLEDRSFRNWQESQSFSKTWYVKGLEKVFTSRYALN